MGFKALKLICSICCRESEPQVNCKTKLHKLRKTGKCYRSLQCSYASCVLIYCYRSQDTTFRLESAQNSNSYTTEKQVKQKQKADPKIFPDIVSPDPPEGEIVVFNKVVQ